MAAAAHAIVEVDGFAYDSWKNPSLFQRVSVELATGEASECCFEVFDSDFQLIDNYTTAGGVKQSVLRVWLGFGPELGEPVFKGLLARVERGEAKTTLRAYDMGFKMRLVKKTEYHNQKDDLAIIKSLAERNGLQFEGPDKPKVLEAHRAMPQDQQSDWEHASERARESGLVLFVRQDTLFAKYPAQVGTAIAALIYKKDFTLLRDFDLCFKVPENVAGRPKQVTVRGRDRGGKRLTGASDENTRGTEGLSIKRDLAKHSKGQATARAQAQKELEREHAFQVSIRTICPLPAVRPDVRLTVLLRELGQLFSGDYLIDKLTHEFSPGKLTTSYELYRDVKE